MSFVKYLGKLFDLVSIQVEFLQSAFKAIDLLRHLLQAAVRVIQNGDDLLLPTEASARHQAPDDLPLGSHLQTLYCKSET